MAIRSFTGGKTVGLRAINGRGGPYFGTKRASNGFNAIGFELTLHDGFGQIGARRGFWVARPNTPGPPPDSGLPQPLRDKSALIVEEGSNLPGRLEGAYMAANAWLSAVKL